MPWCLKKYRKFQNIVRNFVKSIWRLDLPCITISDISYKRHFVIYLFVNLNRFFKISSVLSFFGTSISFCTIIMVVIKFEVPILIKIMFHKIIINRIFHKSCQCLPGISDCFRSNILLLYVRTFFIRLP